MLGRLRSSQPTRVVLRGDEIARGDIERQRRLHGAIRADRSGAVVEGIGGRDAVLLRRGLQRRRHEGRLHLTGGPARVNRQDERGHAGGVRAGHGGTGDGLEQLPRRPERVVDGIGGVPGEHLESGSRDVRLDGSPGGPAGREGRHLVGVDRSRCAGGPGGADLLVRIQEGKQGVRGLRTLEHHGRDPEVVGEQILVRRVVQDHPRRPAPPNIERLLDARDGPTLADHDEVRHGARVHRRAAERVDVSGRRRPPTRRSVRRRRG